jgi:uncharacterized coiled-coil protein SlyX
MSPANHTRPARFAAIMEARVPWWSVRRPARRSRLPAPDEIAKLRDRLQRIEEAQGFAERAAEQLSTEMAEINRRLAELAARLSRLEQRLRSVESPPEKASEGQDDAASEP